MSIIPSAQRIRFGLFEVDANTGELRREGIKVRLQEQVTGGHGEKRSAAKGGRARASAR